MLAANATIFALVTFAVSAVATLRRSSRPKPSACGDERVRWPRAAADHRLPFRHQDTNLGRLKGKLAVRGLAATGSHGWIEVESEAGTCRRAEESADIRG